MSWIDDDICWCGCSAEVEGYDYCSNKECFRHISNRKHHSQPDIYTVGMLKDTEYCPGYKGDD